MGSLRDKGRILHSTRAKTSPAPHRLHAIRTPAAAATAFGEQNRGFGPFGGMKNVRRGGRAGFCTMHEEKELQMREVERKGWNFQFHPCSQSPEATFKQIYRTYSSHISRLDWGAI